MPIHVTRTIPTPVAAGDIWVDPDTWTRRVWTGTLWTTDSPPAATIFVASSTCLEPWKASYSAALGRLLICDSIADEVEIQAAIDALIAGVGGTIQFTEGIYTLANSGAGYSIYIPRTAGKPISFIGQGNSTIFDISNNNIPIIQTEAGAGPWGVATENRNLSSVERIRFTSSTGGAGTGILLEAYTTNYWITECTFDGMRHGITTSNPTGRGHIILNQFWKMSSPNNFDIWAVKLDVAHDTTLLGNRVSFWESGDIAGEYAIGFYLSGGCFEIQIIENEIEDIHSVANNAIGLLIEIGPLNTLVTGNTFAECDRGLVINTATGITTTGNLFADNEVTHVYINDGGNVTIVGNTIAAQAAYIGATGISLNGSAPLVKVLIADNVISGVTTPITQNITGAVIKDNSGYVAEGEVRTASGSLTAGNANAICFAWHNPEAQDILIRKVVIEVTTAGGTPGSHLDVGIADDAAGTNRGTEFFNDLLLNSVQVNDSWVAGDGGTQTKWVFCQDSASATDGWIVGQILDANAASLVGRWYIEYAGR